MAAFPASENIRTAAFPALAGNRMAASAVTYPVAAQAVAPVAVLMPAAEMPVAAVVPVAALLSAAEMPVPELMLPKEQTTATIPLQTQ